MADQSSADSIISLQDSIALSDDELDIHVCGKCKASFTDLTAYIAHKKSKVCSLKAKPDAVVSTDEPEAEIEGENEVYRNTVALPIAPLSPSSTSVGNKVVVELLDPVDVSSVIGDNSVIVHADADTELQLNQTTSAEKPKKRHKRKNSTPKTTRKTAAAAAKKLMESTSDVDDTNSTVTVHIPESQLVHLGSEANSTDNAAARATRKQEATSVFVPIYLTKNSKKTFKCSKCPAEFRSKEERCDHGSLHKKHFKCKDCNKKYFTLESLEAHRISETHIHKCEKCGKVFHSQIYLKRHIAVHVEERNFACDICLKTYTSLANCRAHKRSVHALVKKHVCDECGKAFARKDKLKRHQLIHIPYPNRPVFPCPFRSHTGCTSTFYREDKLKRHLFTHSKEKPYKCEQCDKGFARRDNLNDHMKTHTREFSYVCALCQKGFLGPAKLKKHLKAVHPDQEYDFETLADRARDAPTMASLKATTTTTDAAAATTSMTQEEASFEQDKTLQTQVSVGLDVVSQAICTQPSNYVQPAHEEVDRPYKDKELAIESHGREALISSSLPPAPPLIHQTNCSVTSGQFTLPSASVFIPRIGLQNTSPYGRDMVTIPSDLLSIVRGLDA